MEKGTYGKKSTQSNDLGRFHLTLRIYYAGTELSSQVQHLL